MKKLLAAMLLAVLLSIPSMVFADAAGNGSNGAGVLSETPENGGDSTGVLNNNSRRDINGSAEVSGGLTAVYRFKHKIGATDDEQPDERRDSVELSGRFGTISVGPVLNPSRHSVGSTGYSSLTNGQSESTDRVGSGLSYRVNLGKLRLQADAVMGRNKEQTGDSFQFGAKIDGLMDNGSVSIGHYRHSDKAVHIGDFTNDTEQSSSNSLVGQYRVGGMTMYLGAEEYSVKNDGCPSAPRIARDCIEQGTGTSTFAGIHGGVADTGVNYVFKMEKKKIKSTNNASTPVTTTSSESPWRLGISRHLGGGASVYFETGDPDEAGKSSSTGVWLKVDF